MNHFLSISDLSPEELTHLLDFALALKGEWCQGGNQPVLAGKSLALLFQKPSLRTRVSFEMAMVHLGGYAFYMSPNEVKMGGRESTPDVARVLSGYVDAIMARVFEHEHILQLAEYGSVPVINGLTDFTHPCQALADLMTILEHKGKLNGLKFAYVGDSNNVTRSLLRGAALTGIDFAIASPPGYMLPEEDLVEAEQLQIRKSQIELFENPARAVAGADVIYTDVWTSMGQEAEREKRLQVFPPYQVNKALVANAKSDCIVMHCLPAHRGEEITDEIADGSQSVLFPQAENRLHAQKAVLVKLLKPEVFHG